MKMTHTQTQSFFFYDTKIRLYYVHLLHLFSGRVSCLHCDSASEPAENDQAS